MTSAQSIRSRTARAPGSSVPRSQYCSLSESTLVVITTVGVSTGIRTPDVVRLGVGHQPVLHRHADQPVQHVDQHPVVPGLEQPVLRWPLDLEAGGGQGLGRLFHHVLRDDQIDVVVTLRPTEDPQGVAAGERERHVRGLEGGRGRTQRLPHRGPPGLEGGRSRWGWFGGVDDGYLRPMRLATFNILHGRSMSDGKVDVDRLAAAVATLDADVLALQEVDRDQPRSHLADLTAVAAEAMGAVSHRFVAALVGHPRRHLDGGHRGRACRAPPRTGWPCCRGTR